MSVTQKDRAAEPTPTPGVAVGDELYFQHGGEPRAGRVLAHGKHGCTLEHEGVPHKVAWGNVLGHKKRAEQRYSIVEQGEDGMIVEDDGGKRRFIAVPNEARKNPMVAKAFGDGRRVTMLMKAQSASPRQAGDAVKFKSGDFEGAGKIVGKPGRDGAYVKDSSGSVHQVLWSDMGEPDADAADKSAGGSDEKTTRDLPKSE